MIYNLINIIILFRLDYKLSEQSFFFLLNLSSQEKNLFSPCYLVFFSPWAISTQWLPLLNEFMRKNPGGGGTLG